MGVLCLLAVFATTLLAAPSGRGGKGRGCKNKPSPCADGSSPLCQDGSQPDRSARPPSCADGGSPVCSDGAEPRSPHNGEDIDRNRNPSGRGGRDSRGDEGNDDDSDDECDVKKMGVFGSEKQLGIIIGACVGGSVFIVSLCCCAYCWRRAALLGQLPQNLEHESSNATGHAASENATNGRN